jgi:hypothetical protein
MAGQTINGGKDLIKSRTSRRLKTVYMKTALRRPKNLKLKIPARDRMPVVRNSKCLPFIIIYVYS